MGAKVDRAIAEVQAKGHDKSSAIRILKAGGAIHQNGRHLAAGGSPRAAAAKRISKAKYMSGKC